MIEKNKHIKFTWYGVFTITINIKWKILTCETIFLINTRPNFKLLWKYFNINQN